jgi:hypothetical protein
MPMSTVARMSVPKRSRRYRISLPAARKDRLGSEGAVKLKSRQAASPPLFPRAIAQNNGISRDRSGHAGSNPLCKSLILAALPGGHSAHK